MSNKRQAKNSVAFSAVGALMVAGVVVSPASADEVVVTNCLDSGPGSLRGAVDNASFQDEIMLDQLDCDTIVLNSSIDIFTELSIIGPGASELTITNNSTNNNGLFFGTVINGGFSIAGLTLTTHAAENNLSQPLIYAEGDTTLNLQSVEITGASSYNGAAAILSDGLVLIGDSSFHGNTSVASDMIVGSSVYISNSSFVGNSMFEGTMVVSNNSLAVINSAFVDNIQDSTWFNLLSANGGVVKAYSSIFAEDNVIDARQLMNGDGNPIDLGSNYYALDSSVTEIAGVTNTTVGNGASALVSREDLKLGAFDRVFDSERGLSARHQQLSAGSVAIDSHTFDQFEDANEELATQFGNNLLAKYDAAGDRRPSGPKYDSGPIEFQSGKGGGLISRSKNVLFNPMSSTLTKEARKVLRNMVNNLPEGATVRRINVTGFVQPAGFSWNNKSLSEARAKSVKRFLKTLGVKGQWKIAARGEDKDSTSKARRVKVVVRYDVVPDPI